MKKLGIEFKVGVFTIVGLCATAYLFFVLSPSLLDSQDSNSYYTILKDASGILPKTHVKTNGVTVGKVESVQLDISTTKVLFKVNSNVKIPVGSTLDIRTVGLLGDKFIEILRSEDSSLGYIENNGLIPRAVGGADLNALMDIAGDIAKDIKQITSTLSKVLGGDLGEDRVANIIDNIEGLTANARLMLEENRRDVKELVLNLRETSAALKEITDSENRDRFERILSSFDSSMDDVKGATRRINLITEKVEKGEGTIGRLINDDKTLVELQGALEDIRRVISPATKLKIAVDYQGQYNRDETTQHHFNLQFRTRPDRFYILGISQGNYREIDTTTETLQATEEFDSLNNPVRTRESIRETPELRINLQIAKRWYNTQLRFGMFESTGGMAADFFLFKDKLKYTVEVFDFADKYNNTRAVARVRTYLSMLFFDHLYLVAGVDDATRKDPNTGKVSDKPNAFIGAGMNFNDDDLKALFGAAALVSQ